MAKRPVFIIDDQAPFVRKIDVDFRYYSGCELSQAKKSVESLHAAYVMKCPSDYGKVLEISTRSRLLLGSMLSAFNLPYRDNRGNVYHVENVYQASKCFEKGGPYTDLLKKPAWEVKQDIRLKNSGKLTQYVLNDETFPSEPKTAFYDWLYMNALAQNASWSSQLLNYNAFTDIAFNPEKSINCQARAAAIFVSLSRNELINAALSCFGEFVRIVYGEIPDDCAGGPEQMTMFGMAEF